MARRTRHRRFVGYFEDATARLRGMGLSPALIEALRAYRLLATDNVTGFHEGRPPIAGPDDRQKSRQRPASWSSRRGNMANAPIAGAARYAGPAIQRARDPSHGGRPAGG
jgi:hypothetical protein